MVVVRAESAPRGRACYLGRAEEHNSGLVKRDKKLSGQSHVIKRRDKRKRRREICTEGQEGEKMHVKKKREAEVGVSAR